MNKVVIDTNILVSSLWSQNGNPNRILRLLPEKIITPYFCQDILKEYKKVLRRPKFDFSDLEINKLLKLLLLYGVEVSITASFIPISDESDRIFYDTANESGSILITGNIKHYPVEPFIMTPVEFLDRMYLK
jgi:putative PIN family toxin of toxin-antitoxin system